MRRKWVAGWLLIFALLGGFEMVSVFDGNPATPPLTQVVVKYVPGELIIPFIGWLLLHFYVRYKRKGDL